MVYVQRLVLQFVKMESLNRFVDQHAGRNDYHSRTRIGRLRSVILLVALVAIGACSGSDDAGTGPSNVDTLSAADATDAFSALLTTVLLFQFELSGPAGSPVTVNDTRICPRGGTLLTQGTALDNASTSRFTADVRQTHRDCSAPSDSGRVWTFNGNPNLRLDVTFNTTSGALIAVITGNVRYASEGATGSCTTNVTVNGATDGTATVTGTLCGRTVSATL